MDIKQLNMKNWLHYLLKVLRTNKKQIDNQQEQINELKTLIKTKKMGLKINNALGTDQE
jgi:hypothetical protein